MSDTTVLSVLTGATMSDGSTVFGTWTTTYNPSDMIVSITATLFVQAPDGSTTIFTVPSVTPWANPNNITGQYDVELTNASGGEYNSLYIDWFTTTPATLAVGSFGDPVYLFTSVTPNANPNAVYTLNPSSTGQINDYIICYCAGTRIHTPDGAVSVEDLAVGQAVLLASGDAAPIRWIGHRTIDLSRHKQPDLVRPIRIAAGALADNVPVRDLVVSPDHAMLVDGALIPARMLVNHSSITEETQARVVTYYHVELDRHDIIIAEGALSESYLDTGNRGIFANAPLTGLNPDMSVAQRLRMPENGACMPLATDPEAIFPIWQRLAERAGIPTLAADAAPAAIHDTGISLVVGARTIGPVVAEADRLIFALPRGAQSVRLVSAAARPNKARPWLDDRRMLGVAVNDVRADHVALPLDGPAFGTGWWDVETAGATTYRWSNGDALLSLPEGTKLLTVQISATMADAAEALPRAA
jgi:hypothetical protein